MDRDDLGSYLDSYLKAAQFADYGPNGLQIEGRQEVHKVALSVSASAEAASKCAEWGADALVVHHGLFWNKAAARTITGPFGAKIKTLLCGGINLYAYHLPLDAHRESGNAVGLARALKLEVVAPFGDYSGSPTGIEGRFPAALEAGQLHHRLESVLAKGVVYSQTDVSASIQSVGIITGGAGGDWPLAQKRGLDAYITGEMSEHHWHEAREAGIHMFAGGHHATERFGVLALKEHLREKFALECVFFDSQNPV